jgi:Nuclear protein Es2
MQMATSMRSPGAMAPPPPRQPSRPTTVLDEDEWTLYLEEIIERDFFPDLARLKNRLDWLQASRSGDPEAIREAQMRIQVRDSTRVLWFWLQRDECPLADLPSLCLWMPRSASLDALPQVAQSARRHSGRRLRQDTARLRAEEEAHGQLSLTKATEHSSLLRWRPLLQSTTRWRPLTCDSTTSWCGLLLRVLCCSVSLSPLVGFSLLLRLASRLRTTRRLQTSWSA